MKLAQVVVCLFGSACGLGQSARDQPLVFDVASVRPSKPGTAQHTNVPLDSGNVYSTISADDARSAAGGLLVATHQPLWRYISFAYRLSGTQELALRFNYFSGLPKSGAPAWVTGGFDVGADPFDIEARASGDTSLDQMRLMMRALLAERFHLVVHRESVEAPVFALVQAHPGLPGPNLWVHSASDGCGAASAEGSPAAGAGPSASAAGLLELPPVCGVIAHVLSAADPNTSYGGRGVPLSLLATSLPTMTGMAMISRPVVHQTGMAGLYDFTLHWAFSAGNVEGDDNAAAFREALRNQLGLELRPARAAIDILLVDHVERPSEN
jgi:uncharacterized protein (TIGR03435 family)